MKLTLRPEWKPRPLSSFIGFVDIKTGVSLAVFFTIFNKVAGVYGLIAALTGAGGSFPQISLYLYSTLGLIALAWGLRAVHDEDAKRTLYFAHMFFADHVLSTAWTVFFAVMWWVYNPHDGKRTVNSKAQEDMIHAAPQRGTGPKTDEERVRAAQLIWNQEKGLAAAVISSGWLFKVYLAIVIYSYAIHLRRGTYRTLPLSRSVPLTAGPYSGIPDEDDIDGSDDAEAFYRVPLRNGTSVAASGWRTKTGVPRDTRSIAARMEAGLDAQDVLFDEDEGDLSSTADDSSRPRSRAQNQR